MNWKSIFDAAWNGIVTKPWLAGNILRNKKNTRKLITELLRKFENRGIKIARVNSILITKWINLKLFSLILYGVGFRCDRRRFFVHSPFIEKSMSIHNTATDLQCAMLHSSTTPVKILASLTTRSSSLMCVSAWAPHFRSVLQNHQYRIPKNLSNSRQSWNTHQDFFKIPSRWDAALETERRCFWKVSF